jgi:hypothetical protein
VDRQGSGVARTPLSDRPRQSIKLTRGRVTWQSFHRSRNSPLPCPIPTRSPDTLQSCSPDLRHRSWPMSLPSRMLSHDRVYRAKQTRKKAWPLGTRLQVIGVGEGADCKDRAKDGFVLRFPSPHIPPRVPLHGTSFQDPIGCHSGMVGFVLRFHHGVSHTKSASLAEWVCFASLRNPQRSPSRAMGSTRRINP